MRGSKPRFTPTAPPRSDPSNNYFSSLFCLLSCSLSNLSPLHGNEPENSNATSRERNRSPVHHLDRNRSERAPAARPAALGLPVGLLVALAWAAARPDCPPLPDRAGVWLLRFFLPLPSSRNRIPRFLARRLTPRPAAFLPQRGGAVASGGVGPSIRGLICSCG